MPGEDAPRQRAGTAIALILLFLLIAAVRILLAYQSPLPDYAAYDTLRQVDHIHTTGMPLRHDDLSMGGRDVLFSPLYDYVLALFGLFLPAIWLVKVIPNLFAAAIIFPTYALTRYMFNYRPLAVITAAMAALVPAVFNVGINDASAVPLIMTLLVTATYLFLRSRKSGKHLNRLLIAFIILTLLSPLSILLLIALLLYLGIIRLQGAKMAPKELELFLFLLFLDAWFFLLVYKRALEAHGAAVIWQNIPAAEIAAVFSRITLLQALTSVGVITLVLGVFGLYAALVKTQKKSLTLLASLLITTVALVWFRLLSLETGLALLGIVLALASGYALSLILEYVRQTKASKYAWPIITGIVALFIAMAAPTLLATRTVDTPTSADIKVMLWINEFTDENAVILASPVEGGMIAAVAERKNVIDTQYLLVPRMNERYEDVRKVYRSLFVIDAVGTMQKYGATHLLVTDETASFSGIDKPRFLDDDDCFVLAHEAMTSDGKATKLYQRACSLREG